ncbi:hypothetical protein B0T18DRAFT_403320 [Schizothecium vesticola]|uniref:J domain-containing protein n=1 Tax=Schizothecium vesticola TaxID=314040 RepID=A0AA40F6I2_9PEZI|nr:hypothetical protein B0T18DRAFT_403320 [Schizothecium vesticola]
MRIATISLGLLALLTPLTAAWSKEDREIFRVRDELVAKEGPDVTFYQFLGITPSANQEDINKAYKKRSRELHPDKVRQQLMAERVRVQKEKAKLEGGKPGAAKVKPPSPGEVKAAVKRASERQARLSIVANILRGSGRVRYDHFLSNGFPSWKGTEYYYSRYRPGFGTALFGVFLFAGGIAHYVALYMSWKRQREFVERYITFARRAAWGDNLAAPIPGIDDQPAPVAAPAPPPQQVYQDEDGNNVAMNRKMRRLQERDARKGAAKEAQAQGSTSRKGRRAAAAAREPASGSGSVTPQPQGSGPQGAKKRVVAENGKVLVVDSLGDVYLEQDDEDGNTAEYLLDLNEIHRPTFKDTAVVRLPLAIFSLTVGRFLPKRADEAEDYDDVDEQDVAEEEDDSEPGKATPTTDSAEDFELLEKSVDDLGEVKASGSQRLGNKAGKRKTKKR